MVRHVMSFSYSNRESQASVLDLFDMVLGKFGLVRRGTQDLSRKILDENDLLLAAIDFFGEGSGVVLSHEKVIILTRELSYVRVTYSNLESTLSADVSMSHANDFPALGASIWTDKSLVLPAGFIVINSSDSAQGKEVVDALRQVRTKSM